MPLMFTLVENRIALLHLTGNRPPIPTGVPKMATLIAAAWTNGNIVSKHFRLVDIRYCQAPSIPERVNYFCALSDENDGKISILPSLFDFNSGNPVLVGIQTNYFENGCNLFVLPM